MLLILRFRFYKFLRKTMSNKFGLKAWAEPLRSANFGALTASLAPLGTPYVEPVRIYCFTNGTNVTVFVSFNDSDNMFAVLAGNSMVLDLTTNKSFDDGLYLAVGNSTYVAYATIPTSGAVYLSVVYGTSERTL